MALIPPGVDYIAGADATTRVYGPVSYGPKVLSFIAHFQRASADNTTPAKGSIDSTAGLTWTEVGDAVAAGAASIPGVRVTVWAAVVPAAVDNNTITVTRGANAGYHALYAAAVVNASPDLINAGGDDDTGGAVSINLPRAPTATGMILTFYTDHLATATAPPTNYTELRDDLITGSAGAIQMCYDNGSAAQAVAWAETGHAAAVAVEVREPSTDNFAFNAGTYALTGANFGLIRRPVLPIASGAYALSGAAMDLELRRRLAISPGAYALTGTDFGLRFQITCPIEIGSYALTGRTVRFAHWAMHDEAQGDWNAVPGNAASWTPVTSPDEQWTPL